MCLNFKSVPGLLVILVFFSSSRTCAQDVHTTVSSYVEFALRGKVAAGFILEDMLFMNASIGGELTLNDEHSLGVDVTWFRWRFQTDNSTDVPMYDQFERRSYLYVDYRYRFSNYMYLISYVKVGEFKSWWNVHDYDLIKKDTSFLRSTTVGSFTALGIGLGAKKEMWGNLGIDGSISVEERFKNYNIYDVTSPTESTYAKNVKSQNPVPYIRMNLFYRFD